MLCTIELFNHLRRLTTMSFCHHPMYVRGTIEKWESTVEQELIRRWDTRTWRDVSSYMITYLPLNNDTSVLQKYFWSNAYISNGRRFTKSALRILLLSTFRVSSINYFLFCSLSIHTRSPTNAEGPRAHCQSKSCKMLHKCSTDCIWKGLQPVNDLPCHSRSLPLLPFDRPYMIPVSLPLEVYLHLAPFLRY